MADTATSCFLAQRVRYDYTAPIEDLCQRLLLVPPSVHGHQRRHGWTLVVGGAVATSTRARRDSFGNLALELRVPRVDEWVEFVVTTEVTRRAPSGAHRVRPDRRYLEPTRLTAPDVAIGALVAQAAEAVDPAAISAAVHAAIGYEWGITGVRTTAAEALAGGRGVCQDYAHLMLAACRLAGIPCRYVSGHLLGEGGSHAWVEVFRPDVRCANSWVVEAWDPTHDRRVGDDPHYVTVAVGRDYDDVAPLSGTYEGHAVGRLTCSKRAAPVLPFS